ncbi:hypothetical protein BN1221_02401c [Brenneria goodwinii]|uniref:Uncharacterized protein n=1 Tax=Brenneria goodwinii TaxID=1109412 RepID=A0A0G4JVG6_9GAMM|nr:hypothetical protein BN1221_02401c [Brenneria goodwinii]
MAAVYRYHSKPQCYLTARTTRPAGMCGVDCPEAKEIKY